MKLKNYALISLFSLPLLLSGCDQSKELTGFDDQAWKTDLYGCNGERLKMLNNLNAVKDEIKGLTEDQIADLLGKPDRNELYKRNQKFFIYDISNSSFCESTIEGKTYQYLSIRFNATGRAKEVLVYKE